MKKQYIILIFTILALAFILISCSDLKKVLPTAVPASTAVHESGWNDTSSINFHGRALKAANYDLKKCITCHSAQFNGGTSGIVCDSCHSSYPHKSGWEANDEVIVSDVIVVSGINGRWKVNPLDSSGMRFSLQGAHAGGGGVSVSVSGLVVPVAAMPDCTGTVIQGGTDGGLPMVDPTKPCKPWSRFIPGEMREY